MTNEHNEVATPGGRIGARLAKLISDAMVHTNSQLGRTKSDVAHEVLTTFTNHVSDEVRSAMGPLFHKMANDPQTAEEIKPLLTHLATERGQAWGWIAGSATGAALGGGLLDLITNYLNPIVKPLIAAAPAATLDAQAAAIATQRGFVGLEEGRREAAYSGLDQDRFETLVQLAERPPTPAEVMELLRRGQIQHTTAVAHLRRNGFTLGDAGMFLTMREGPLSAEAMAAAWARSLAEPDDVYKAAEVFGYNRPDADRLMGLAGEPPNMEALITAWRRGIITEADVDRGIIQGPVRNEWIPTLKALQQLPLSPEEAASAVTQGHLSASQGFAKAQLSGVSQEDFDVIVENSGLPPGIEFAAEAFNRGLITDRQWEELFLASRIKNKYIPLMRAMRTNAIPTETVRMMYRLGVYPRDAAKKVLLGHGFTDVDAEAQLALEDNRRTEVTKDLTRSQILGLFSDGIIPRGQAETMLRDMGFDEQETAWQVELVEMDKLRRFVNATVTRIRSAYVGGHFDEAQAADLLDQTGMAIEERDRVIALWDLERETVSASLTVAQVTSSVKKGILTFDEGMRRLVGRGYSEGDAIILFRLAGFDPAEVEES
jgi:hypothetical protein